jgi:hypothetical protein
VSIAEKDKTHASDSRAPLTHLEALEAGNQGLVLLSQLGDFLGIGAGLCLRALLVGATVTLCVCCS